MEPKVIYSPTDYNFDEVKNDLIEANDFAEDKVTDEMVYDYMADMERWEWEDFIDCTKHEKDNPCVITGYFMSWMGPQNGGMIRENLKTAIKAIIMDDSTPIFSFNSNGEFVLDETHHDAPCNGNHYVFKVLTDKGTTWYNNHKDSLSRMELCEHLTNTRGLSRNVDPKIFNC